MKDVTVLAFHNATEAMAFAKAAKASALQGRLIPAPSQITTQCGFVFWLEHGDESSIAQAQAVGSFAKIYRMKL